MREFPNLVLQGKVTKECKGADGPFMLIKINGHIFIDKLTCSGWTGKTPKENQTVKVWDIFETQNGYRAGKGVIAEERIFLPSPRFSPNDTSSAKKIAEMEKTLEIANMLNSTLQKQYIEVVDEINCLKKQMEEERKAAFSETDRLRKIVGEVPLIVERFLRDTLNH